MERKAYITCECDTPIITLVLAESNGARCQ